MKDVIKMARESRLDVYGLGKDYLAFVAALQRFAVLVRADERALAEPVQEFVCSTGLCHYRKPQQEPVAWKWHQAPVKTAWGDEMVVADLAIDKDHTVSVYCERNQTAKVEAMFTPPAAPVQEPIGYLFQHEETGLTAVVDVQQVEWGFEKNNPRHQKIGPVYTSPPAAPDLQAELDATNRQVEILSDALAESRREVAARRKPLNDAQLLYAYNSLPSWDWDLERLSPNLKKFARAIEAAHGIKELNT